MCRLQRKRIDGEAGILQTDIEIGSAKDARQRLVAAAQIEDEGQRVVLLRGLKGSGERETFARASSAEQQRVRHVAAMQIQVVRRAVRRFEHGEIFPLQMRVPLRTGIDREQERQVGVIGIQRPLLAQIELPVAWHRGKEGIEQVVAFFVQQAVMLGEQLLELRDGVFHLHAVLVVDHDGQRELAEVLALHAERRQRIAQFGDGGFLRVIDQLITWSGVLAVLEIRDEAGLGVVVMTAAIVDLLAGLARYRPDAIR